ncbi:MAG: aldehyde dehydrogenase [Bacillus thermozeamaize]|uniref:Aldehyde dehydrogenase n=1 Tax=Bacillus thermozeamaize TaxID=230954 RepID=A0A1Y3PMV3_9BACI|nr:MAG: aldehyde dehydrogenase [Bacillus thermozeamaize]
METLAAINPATGETLDEIPVTPIQACAGMVQDGRKAFEAWRQEPLSSRIEALRRLRAYIVDHLDELADVIARDTGKPKVEALTADILVVADAIHYVEKHAASILAPKKVKTPLTLIGKRSYISYHPRGVVLVISPWNYPFQLAMVPVISALAAGNSVILKPSEVTPLVGKMIEDLFQKVDFPDKVVQVAHGDGRVGAALVATAPDYIFFTGSVRTGKIIQQEAAKRLIPTTLELGGKDPMIVFADAHLERAAKGAVWGALTNSGQVCMSVERIYVEKPVYERFIHLLRQEVEALSQEMDAETTDLGSMTFPRQLDIVRDQVAEALSGGARLVCGLPPEQWKKGKGLHVQPMILTDLSPEMKIMREETFGPVLCVLPFEREEEVIHLANDSPYGLNASVWSGDLDKARRVADALVSGAVVINDVIVSVSNPHLPFGGVKESGIGRYHAEIGLQTFCHQKSIVLDKGKRRSEVHWFPYRGKWEPFRQLIKNHYGRRKNLAGFVRAYLDLLKLSK